MKVDIEMSKERLVESIKSIQKQWDDLNAELNDNCSTGTAFLIKTIYTESSKKTTDAEASWTKCL